MKVIAKNLGKTVVVLGTTLIQAIALMLRIISLIFEGISWMFKVLCGVLLKFTKYMLRKIGFSNDKVKERTT